MAHFLLAPKHPAHKRKRPDTDSNTPTIMHPGLRVERDGPRGSRVERDTRYDNSGMPTTTETLVADYSDQPVHLKKPKVGGEKRRKGPVPRTKEENRQTETAKIIGQFREQENEIGLKVLAAEEADRTIGLPCVCDSGRVCEMQCHDCLQYEASCLECFIKAHIHNPLHWAKKWDPVAGHFVRHTLSSLGHHLRLGHRGKACQANASSYIFVILAENGVQSVRVEFCSHPGQHTARNLKVDQLLEARLYPCTLDDPNSAITFNALRHFQMLHLESKVAAYDYCNALRRLSDNAFTEEVPDLYENFLRCSRTWGLVTTRRRLGCLHGLDERTGGSMVVFCPRCPQPGFNTDPNLVDLPSNLRHLNQQRDTIDGNFHCTKTANNSDPSDTSLYNGDAYFPSKQVLDEHIASVRRSPLRTEKSGCSYLKAVNNQDKKKFKNMEITGIVNIQCSHVFIKASVDLQVGERWENVDLALATAIRRYRAAGHRGKVTFKFVDDRVDRVTSYDSGCQYWVHVVERFEKFFPDCADFVRRMRWAVPALHIQGHKEDCMYEFSAAYMEAVGHFHRETAEVYWPELNQLGPQVTRQSAGHRQDTIINHHNDWNYKKLAKSFLLIQADLKRADLLYNRHWNHFVDLCRTHAVRLLSEGWLERSRAPDKTDKNYVKSVYRRASAKVPSVKAVYERMLASEADLDNSKAKRRDAGAFIGEGLRIQEKQGEIRSLVVQLRKHNLVALESDISKKRSELETMIAGWRRTQRTLMPMVEEFLRELPGRLVEDELLGVPSDFSPEQRSEYQLQSLGELEAELREGEAFDALQLVKLKAKNLVTFRDRKKKQDSGVYRNTRASHLIKETEQKRDLHIAHYNTCRTALAQLRPGGNVDAQWPILKVADTFMKSRSLRRQLGDSRLVDGPLWTQGSVASGARATTSAMGTSATTAEAGRTRERIAGTVMERRRGPARTGEARAQAKSAIQASTEPKRVPHKNGWIWAFKVGAMGKDELDAWNSEGDQIQWFRAEAEMSRWREEVECQLVEWMNTLRSFAAYRRAWIMSVPAKEKEKEELEERMKEQMKLPELERKQSVRMEIEKRMSQLLALIAYAREKAAMFGRREEKGKELLQKTLGGKYASLLEPAFNLREFVEQRRRNDQSILDAIWAENRLAAESLQARTEADGEDDSSDEESWQTVDEQESDDESDEEEVDESDEEEVDEDAGAAEEELATLLAA